MFDWVENRFLAQGWKYWAHSEITQPENMCDNVFEKVKGHGETVNRRNVYAEAAVQRVF